MRDYIEILGEVIRIATFQDRLRNRSRSFPRLGEVDLDRHPHHRAKTPECRCR